MHRVLRRGRLGEIDFRDEIRILRLIGLDRRLGQRQIAGDIDNAKCYRAFGHGKVLRPGARPYGQSAHKRNRHCRDRRK